MNRGGVWGGTSSVRIFLQRDRYIKREALRLRQARLLIDSFARSAQKEPYAEQKYLDGREIFWLHVRRNW